MGMHCMQMKTKTPHPSHFSRISVDNIFAIHARITSKIPKNLGTPRGLRVSNHVCYSDYLGNLEISGCVTKAPTASCLPSAGHPTPIATVESLYMKVAEQHHERIVPRLRQRITYRVELVEDSDLDYIVPRMFQAMGNDYEFMNVMWPGHHTPDGQRKIVSRLLAGKNAAPNTKWIKAVAVDTGEIVGSLLAPRRKAIRENELPIILINMMAVFVEHQKKGIGKLLLDWVLQIADEMKALCTLEGTLTGQNLYRKGGFAVEQDIIIDAGEEYADRPKDHVLFMVRPRGGPSSTKI
ncbi:hypothetical protein P171DRAFT_446289 [Karstenula rhodostoma CBS 690.94]|uniref:N-acetyltransferase domain-containing protein n=1 Tax=Karstenula rhodostoma CBS 690.94 TaxID=1392251 RepID=A0A9P4PDX7_9PLEO|nr:hypothetical protein P171DRAFT_446289 [Karstenula rhodostoma CBS 690.94]